MIVGPEKCWCEWSWFGGVVPLAFYGMNVILKECFPLQFVSLTCHQHSAMFHGQNLSGRAMSVRLVCFAFKRISLRLFLVIPSKNTLTRKTQCFHMQEARLQSLRERREDTSWCLYKSAGSQLGAILYCQSDISRYVSIQVSDEVFMTQMLAAPTVCKLMKALVSKGSLVPCLWGSETLKFGLKRVVKRQFTAVNR